MSALAPPMPPRALALARRGSRLRRHALGAFFVVIAAYLALAAYAASKGLVWNDAGARVHAALTVLYGSDPHLAALGFTWMPLPTLLDLIPTAFYPVLPSIAATGFGASIVTAAVAGGLAATLLLVTDRFGLPLRIGWLVVALTAANPVLLLYGSNGMSEGLGGSALIAAVAFLALYWRTGRRRYVGVSGVALAIAVGSVYQATVFAATMLLALALTVVFARRAPAPRGRRHELVALGSLLVLPSAFVMALWLIANAVIKGDAFAFAHDSYSSAAQQVTLAKSGLAVWANQGDIGGSLLYVGERTWPVALPLVALLVVRLVDGRLFRVRTAALLSLALGVSLTLELWRVYHGSSGGYFRYLFYPLYAAAGWTLYEIATSARRRRAVAIVAAGWIACWGTVYVAMMNPHVGYDERPVLMSLLGTHGSDAAPTTQRLISESRPAARFLEREVFSHGGRILADDATAWPLHLAVDKRYVKDFVMSDDRNFDRALADPRKRGIDWILIEDPALLPQDAIVRARPEMWRGGDPSVTLAARLRATGPKRAEWRLFRVVR